MPSDTVEVMVVGNYCHDELVSQSGVQPALGGSAAYAASVLSAFDVRFTVVAKVGRDFKYSKDVPVPPRVVESRTTTFVNDYTTGERVQTLRAACERIRPDELESRAEVGIACPVAGEIPPETLLRMRELSRILIADVQGFIRVFGPGGAVSNRRFDATPYIEAAGRLDYLKVSEDEARRLDIDVLRWKMGVIVTEGPRGCTLYRRGQTLHVPGFVADLQDSTGAGDCFLAGFAVGLLRDLPIERALELANFCGARAVEQVGIPVFRREELQKLL